MTNKLCFSLILFCFNTLAAGLTYPSFLQMPTSKYLTMSHTEGDGLGYCKGYTSLELFLAQPLCNCRFVPFVDPRGHMFNNGIWATNAGIGVRYIDPCTQIWGVNVFYDSYLTRRVPYHQIGIGLETIGSCWEANVNGYLPVSRKSTPIYLIAYDFTSGFLAKVRQQFAMGGVDAEIGYHFRNMRYFDIYAGLGPYAYRGRAQETVNAFQAITKRAVGGRLRTVATFFKYFTFEGLATYDSCFKWGGQATFALNIPLDGFCCKQTNDCLASRLYQQVRRNEIIVVDRIDRFSDDPSILDPENVP